SPRNVLSSGEETTHREILDAERAAFLKKKKEHRHSNVSISLKGDHARRHDWEPASPREAPQSAV
ncbi:MAG TPA: hypothetical protein VEJ47_06245, partial [Candidatus Eremiobacteraceae bacterium]|nr:hypothetical protein [Candidatus Eremiobacteraceae bacterium]